MLRIRSKQSVPNEYRCLIKFVVTVLVVENVQECWDNLLETKILYGVILPVERTMARLIYEFSYFYATRAETRLGIVAHVQIVSQAN